MKEFSINEINEIVQGEIIGNTSQIFVGPEHLKKASKNQISFIGNKNFIKDWETSDAGAVIVNADLEIKSREGRVVIKVDNADLAMAKILEVFEPDSPKFEIDIHPSASIHNTAIIGKGCKIGAGCYVGANVALGDGVVLYPNVSIFDDTKIGERTIVWSGTVIRERSEIGSDCIFHINVSIGADGFGYRPTEDGRGLVKIPQIGNVVIGNNVEIGANSCVDRAKFSSTIIGDGCKIDNLVQIAHNCILGRSCIMAGNSGLAGSVTLGDGVIIGGAASIIDHITIGDGAIVGACSGVTKSVKPGETVVGFPAHEYHHMMKQWAALRRLVK